MMVRSAVETLVGWLQHSSQGSRVRYHFLFIPCSVYLSRFLNVTEKRIVYAQCFVNHAFFVALRIFFGNEPHSPPLQIAFVTMRGDVRNNGFKMARPLALEHSLGEPIHWKNSVFFFDLLCKYAGTFHHSVCSVRFVLFCS